ncbi:hypothetical protein O181_068525 [Austropuccinia psidii MF-1]|uniref:Uncharacterized protein n=1 Tax=Austropuccinia psidii MF-1 TaxID=1389203 RepID=A0A9Q3ESP7_9BASI|nr:hypothetical protein [Austropuccinia psidii MF-1]
MPVQNSPPPAKKTRSQRSQSVLAPTERDPLEYTPSVHQLSVNLDRGPPFRRGGIESRRSRSFSGLMGGYPGLSQGTRSRFGMLKMKWKIPWQVPPKLWRLQI